MKPRMLGACQSVAATISLRLAPSARRTSSRTMAFLLPSRAVGGASFAVAPLAALALLRRDVGRLWRGSGRQGLDCPPDARDRRLAVRELLDWPQVAEGDRSGEGIPDLREAGNGPVGGELGELLLCGEAVLAFGNPLGGGEGGDVVVGGDCERVHVWLLIQNSISSTIWRVSS